MTVKTVIDSGVAIKWFVAEEDSDQPILILSEYKHRKIPLLAPSLIYAEYGNVIWKKQVFNNLDPKEADFAIQEFRKISFTLTPTTALFEDAFQIAVKYKRTFYDSLYLALSVRENCGFVTADEKFYNAVKPDFLRMILLADWQ